MAISLLSWLGVYFALSAAFGVLSFDDELLAEEPGLIGMAIGVLMAPGFASVVLKALQ
jgi:hypothetical protein